MTTDKHVPTVSFEFFPPNTEAMEKTLWASIQRLEQLQPNFVSVTYGADGSTRERTHAAVRRILDETGLPPAAHLTCVGASREEIDEIARDYWNMGVRHIVALRGDTPEGAGGDYQPDPNGYAYANDLVAGLRNVADFEISVGAYPEIHPDAPDADFDLENLKRKLDAGANRALTQFFFEPETFFRFRDRVDAAGITTPIVPGILPVSNFKQASKFAAACGASVPHWMTGLFEGLDDVGTRQLVATALAAEFCSRLYEGGVRDFHFYTLNRADLSRALCHLLGKHVTHELEPAA